MENKRMSFEVDANSIDIKQLLQKDFLELSMRVISDANPNVNKSWFTLESMQNAVDSGNFANKPILGYFENGDFVSHDGEWNYDTETQMNYWDTLGKKGERILGIIRESDPVEIVQGSDGLNWIELKCCLWVNYSYKQVKRLLKDAKKAKDEGGLAKNVSVEVDVTDFEKLPNGILKIKNFDLIGVTILGSRNGVKVKPGIENAGLSVIDIMGTEVFEAQKQAIRMAYEKLDSPNNKKEEVSKMENENKVLEDQVAQEAAVKAENEVTQFSSEDASVVNSESETTLASAPAESQSEEVTFEEGKTTCEGEICPDCGNNPCTCESKKCESDEDKDEDKKDDDADDKDKEDAEKNCKFDGDENECPGCANETVYDLAYLAIQMADFATHLGYTCKYYEEYKGDKEAIVSTLQRIKRQYAEDIAVVGELVKGATDDLKNSIINFEKNIEEDTIASLYKKYEEEKAKNEQYSAKIQEIEKSEFLNKAKEMLDLSKFDEEYTNTMFEACKSGEISDVDTLKQKLALKLFEATINGNKENKEEAPAEKPVEVIENLAFNAPVENPDTTSVFESNNNKAKKASSWDILKEYNKR